MKRIAMMKITVKSDNEPFEDEHLPWHFVPFNVQAIGNEICRIGQGSVAKR